jgi:hypothetical protein
MKRLKKILKWTGIVLGALVAVLLIANAWFVWTTDTRLEKQLAAIRAAGDPLTLADLARPPIPPEKNAATYLRQAEAEVTAIEHEIWQWIEAEKQMELSQYLSEKHPMPEKMRKAMNAIYAKHPRAIELLQQAADCPDYDVQLCLLSPEQHLTQLILIGQQLRRSMRVLQYRSLQLASDGNSNEAARLALAILRIARHLKRNPTVVYYFSSACLQGTAIEAANYALQLGPVSKDIRQALDAELAIQERTDGFAWAFKSDRAFTLDVNRCDPQRNFWLYSRGRWNQHESEYLDEIQVFLDAAHDPRSFRETTQTIEKFNANVSFITGTYAQELFLSLQGIYCYVTQIRAKIRCLRVLIVLQNYATTENEQIPKLSELGLPIETTTDPFTGDPLHIKKLPQGWLVYSVGSNCQDDGGKLDNPNTGDVGIGPPLPATKTDEPAK